MTGKHTPGPWQVKLTSCFVDGLPVAGVWVEAPPYTSIANLIPHVGVEANARLIAAAPELLAALKALVDDYAQLCGDGIVVDTEPSVLTAASCAIAKAEAL